MNIFQAKTEQLDELAGLFDQYRIFYEQDSDRVACRYFLQERLQKNESVIFAARSDSRELIGFTQLYCSFCSVEMKPLVYLYDLFVIPGARRSGVARALMAAAKQFAQDHGAGRLQLETAITNTQAQALYEDLGWRKDTEFFTYHLAL
ncbi:GNAT family N-acetyltransferase [Pseudomonadota bacterium]